MKINIQNLEKDLIEIDGTIDLDFLEKGLQKHYREKADVHVIVDHFDRDYRVDIELETTASYDCDCCLETFLEKVELRQRILFHVGDSGNIDKEEIVVLPDNTIELDLAPMFAEMIVLNHPIKMSCSDSCKGICPDCGVDLNKEECKCTDEPIDPRWAQLKKLIK